MTEREARKMLRDNPGVVALTDWGKKLEQSVFEHDEKKA
jgi:hypothetical protein